jgi:hypothetical protein
MIIVGSQTNGRQVSSDSYGGYLDHESEPRPRRMIEPELEAELLSNRYFLKKRVWKNMDKIKRHNSAREQNWKPGQKRVKHYHGYSF